MSMFHKDCQYHAIFLFEQNCLHYCCKKVSILNLILSPVHSMKLTVMLLKDSKLGHTKSISRGEAIWCSGVTWMALGKKLHQRRRIDHIQGDLQLHELWTTRGWDLSVHFNGIKTELAYVSSIGSVTISEGYINHPLEWKEHFL